MKRGHQLLATLTFSWLSLFADDHKNNWIQLFNGKDLSDWTVKIRGHKAGINHNDTFSVNFLLVKTHGKFINKLTYKFLITKIY